MDREKEDRKPQNPDEGVVIPPDPVIEVREADVRFVLVDGFTVA